MPNHADLTGTELHEPKGVSNANVAEVYVADGAGSGSWQKLTANSFTGTARPSYWLYVGVSSASGFATSSDQLVAIPENSTFEGLMLIYTATGPSTLLTVRNNSTSANTIYSNNTLSGTDQPMVVTSGFTNTSLTGGNYIQVETSTNTSGSSLSCKTWIKISA